MNITRILIGIDESIYADHAAQYGFNLARKLNAAVGIVNIIAPVPVTGSPMTDTTFGLSFDGGADINSAELIEAQNQSADTLMSRVIQSYGSDLQVTQFTDYGSSADGIINCAAQFAANLIVIGTHHRSGLDRLLMGSVAADVVKNANMPVLVVPMNEE
jgi:nucleotide-binding universal stress UspA family protein